MCIYIYMYKRRTTTAKADTTVKPPGQVVPPVGALKSETAILLESWTLGSDAESAKEPKPP